MDLILDHDISGGNWDCLFHFHMIVLKDNSLIGIGLVIKVSRSITLVQTKISQQLLYGLTEDEPF